MYTASVDVVFTFRSPISSKNCFSFFLWFKVCSFVNNTAFYEKIGLSYVRFEGFTKSVTSETIFLCLCIIVFRLSQLFRNLTNLNQQTSPFICKNLV